MIDETFAQIVTDVGLMIQKTDSEYATKIKNFINLKYMDWVSKYPWTELLLDTTADTVAGQEFLILPKEIDEVMVITQRTTNKILMSMSESERQRRYLSSITTLGNEFGFAPVGEVGAMAVPAAATLFDIVSSDVADGAAFKVRVWGKSGGEQQSELVTLNGTTAASTIKLYTRLDRVSKNANTTGIITVSKGGTTYATLAPLEETARYKRIKLIRVPQGIDTLYITGFRRVWPLQNDEDVPEIPVAYALRQAAYAYCLKEQRQFDKAMVEAASAEEHVLAQYSKGATRGDKLEQSIPMFDPGRTQYSGISGSVFS